MEPKAKSVGPEKSGPTDRGFSAERVVQGTVTTLSTLISGLGIAALLVHVVLDVGMRYFLNQPLRGPIEWVAFWYMIAIGLGGLALASSRKEHITVTLVTDRLSPGLDKAVAVAANTLTMIVVAAIGYYGVFAAVANTQLRQTGGAAGVSIWPTRWLVPLGALLFITQLVLNTIRLIRR